MESCYIKFHAIAESPVHLFKTTTTIHKLILNLVSRKSVI